MKFISSGLVGAMSGSVGAVTASRNRYGAYLRARAIPVNPNTSFQLGTRASLSNLSTAWSGLTTGERLAWKEWADQNPIVDRLGQVQNLAPNAAFIQLNARLLAVGIAAVNSPPIVVAPDALTTLTSTVDIGVGGTFDLAFTATPLGAAESLWIQGAVTNSAGINYVTNRLRFLGESAAAQASPFDSQSLIETRFGTLVVGVTVHQWISVLDQNSGLLSPPRRTSGVVTDTP